MDERLIAADPRDVMRRMAEAYLAAPAIPVQQGEIRLASHQVDAASRLLELLGECGGAVLADATGLGKTFVAIAVVRAIGPALVVAPAALRSMWRESLERAGVTAELVTYEALSRGAVRVAGTAPLLVLDEAHHARNPRARRYAAIADLAWGAKVLLLSATPIHNRGRDLRALVALFVGSRAATMSDDELRRLMVRRTSGSIGASMLPDIGNPEWLSVPRDHSMLHAISQLPPAVPASDGGTAHALIMLGLIRSWSSSEAALRASLRRRLRRAASFTAILESGRVPERRELRTWPVVDDAIQLGFPELLRGTYSVVDAAGVLQALDTHCNGVRSILRTLDGRCGASDIARIRNLTTIRSRHPSVPIVAFTQFADTAIATFQACVRDGGVALITGRGARIASGRVSVEEIVAGFDIAEGARAASPVMPLHLLIATDVLSEGLSLRRAGIIVHLDLPWTIARLEQRVGRLRRIGSRHRSVHVYAIGPPVSGRELLPVVRALQRKARLASSTAGLEEMQSALPLVGERLTKATATIIRRGESQAVEELRRALSSWIGRDADERSLAPIADEPHFVALALIGRESSHQLLALNEAGVCEGPAHLLRAVRMLSSRVASGIHAGLADHIPASVTVAAELVERWLNEDRGREIVRPATDAPSATHIAVLRALQEVLSTTTRSDRAAVSKRIERCRHLVTSTRGIGAEMALARLVNAGERSPAPRLALDDLEALLSSRASLSPPPSRHAHLVAMLCCSPDHEGEVSAFALDDRA